jgi:phosphoenolpyruvate synthase
VQGKVDPDEFYVHKPTFRQGYRAVLSRSLGGKQVRLVYARGRSTRNLPTGKAVRERFCLSDAEVLELAGSAIRIEERYSMLAGHLTPMDIEWAKDGEDGRLYIVQARPETVASRRAPDAFETYTLKATGAVLITGRAVGEKIASGTVRVVTDARHLASFRPGEVLVAEATSPDWEPVMKTAAAIVTSRGGRTCHAAIVARELGVPAVVGASGATARLTTGMAVTVSCAGGETGTVYDGVLPFEATRVPAGAAPRPRTRIMVNLGNPELAYHTAMLPSDGVGLARMEFMINQHIGVHPMALAHPEKISLKTARAAIARLTRNYPSATDFFVEKLSEGVGTIAGAFYPRPVIVRLSDFKTNEYASLLGGAGFEPKENNPMLGFRGASRYAHPAYAEGFALECRALARVRNEMGLTNLRVMVPFCRRVVEGEQVIRAMAQHGLKRGENGLEIYVMAEIPNNVIAIDAFAALFDGFSIGSNDLTQLTLGVDGDSEIVAFDFDERDPGMLEMLRLAVTGAKRNHRHVGICGEAPANYPEIAGFLAELESTRSASTRQVCCARSPLSTTPSSQRPPIRSPHSSGAVMQPIVTLTMNPALDIATSTDRIVPTHKLRCTAPRYDPGGGGINVARAVHARGGGRCGCGFPGGRTCRRNDPPHVEAGGRCASPDCDRRVHPRKPRGRGAPDRETVPLHLPGPELSGRDQERCLDELSLLAPKAAYIVASGSLPLGVPEDFYARVGEFARRLGKRLILDTSGAALKQAGGEIYLLKPSLSELASLTGREIRTQRDQERAARELIEHRRGEIIVVSLGAEGVLLVTAEQTERFAAIPVQARSTVGAGDSMLAGVVLGLSRGLPLRDATRFGMAAGAARCWDPGPISADEKMWNVSLRGVRTTRHQRKNRVRDPSRSGRREHNPGASDQRESERCGPNTSLWHAPRADCL